VKSIKLSIISLFSLLALIGTGPSFAQEIEQVTVSEGTVLRLALAARTPIGKIGQPVEARVVEPVYAYDKLVIPVETKVYGTVTALNPISRGERILAMTGGDFTPIRDPEIQFDRLEMPDGSIIQINTTATHRNTRIVELHDRKSKGESLFKSAKDMARDKLGFKPGGPSKLDLIRNELFSYLPYHPQHLNRGSLLDAVLDEPLNLSIPASEPTDISHIGEPIPNDTLVHARLVTELGSNISTEEEPIEAVLTEPVWGPEHELLYPEGTKILGKVIKAKQAGWFGRSGQLRFVFQSIQLPAGTEEDIQGQIEALETQKKQNITLDAEGGTRAHFNNRFLAPILNYALADFASKPGKSRIKRAVVSNGFKLAGRISGFLGTQNVSTALSYYGMGRSVYTNIISKGPEATFPANSRLEIRISQRR